MKIKLFAIWSNLWLPLLYVLLPVLAACVTPTATEPAGVTPSATDTATATATVTPTATATPKPIESPTSTPTSTSPSAQTCPPLQATGQILFSAVPCSETYFECELTESSVANLYVINSDGTGLRQLLTGGHLLAGLSLSPDGQKIAFIDSREDVQFWPFDSHIYVWDMTIKETKPLMADLPDESAPQSPQWFPDNARIAYMSNVVDERGTMLHNSQADLYVAQIDNAKRTKIIQRPSRTSMRQITVSPDGSQIAFIGQEFDSHHISAFAVNADGSNLRELMLLSNSAYQARLFWSHTGEKLFVEPHIDEMEPLYVIEMKTDDVASPISIALPGLLSDWRTTTDEEVLELLICEPGIGSSLWTLNSSNYQVKEMFKIPGEVCINLHDWSTDGKWAVSGERTQSLNALDIQSGCQYQILDEYRILDLVWLPENVVLPQ